MRIPRDLSGADLIRTLTVLGYTVTRQTGSHVRLTTQQRGEHHITVPLHGDLRLGTVSGILANIASHFGLGRAEVIERLFGPQR